LLNHKIKKLKLTRIKGYLFKYVQKDIKMIRINIKLEIEINVSLKVVLIGYKMD